MVFNSVSDFRRGAKPYRNYIMEHDDSEQRSTLGRQCRYAFEAGQVIVTFPVESKENVRG